MITAERTLAISNDIALPIDAVTAKLAFFGENGAGKTYAAMKLAETMWEAGAQFVAFDPVGVWYGLRIGDKGMPGLPIVVFGGLKGDLDIGPHDGALIASVVVEEGISAVVDVSQFETDYQKAQFASEFAERFYFLKKEKQGAVHLFLEEAQEFVAENPSGGPSSKDTLMANRFQRIWKIGRNYGIGGSLISQRPQEISKKALNLSGAVFCFRLSGPHERDYMAKWLSGYGVKPDLPSIATGRPYLWSPSWLKHNDFVQIAEKRTCDVSATPKVGDVQKARVLASVEVEALRGRLAKPAEAEVQPPAEGERAIQARIAIAVERAMAPYRVRQAEIADDLEQLALDVSEKARAIDKLVAVLRTGQQAGARLPAWDIPGPVGATHPVQPAPRSAPESRSTAPTNGQAKAVTGPQLRILAALESFRAIGVLSLSKSNCAVFSDQSPRSSGYRNNLSALRSAGYADYGAEGVVITPAGSALVGPQPSPPTLQALHDAWSAKLKSRPRAAMLRKLIEVYPDGIHRSALATATNQSPASSGYRNNLSGLRGLGLVAYNGPDVHATALLFPEGLR